MTVFVVILLCFVSRGAIYFGILFLILYFSTFIIFLQALEIKSKFMYKVLFLFMLNINKGLPQVFLCIKNYLCFFHLNNIVEWISYLNCGCVVFIVMRHSCQSCYVNVCKLLLGCQFSSYQTPWLDFISVNKFVGVVFNQFM